MRDSLTKVLFICLGNICRSPLAQGIFENKVNERGIASQFYIDSAGTSSWHVGSQPHPGSIKIANKYSIDISKQRARTVTYSDGNEFNYLIVMDKKNLSSLLNEFQMPQKNIFLIRSFDKNNEQKVEIDIPDPYGQGEDGFDYVYTLLEHSLTNFLEFILYNTDIQ